MRKVLIVGFAAFALFAAAAAHADLVSVHNIGGVANTSTGKIDKVFVPGTTNTTVLPHVCADLTNAGTGCSTTVGTMATQNANAVSISGGTAVGLTSIAIGTATPNANAVLDVTSTTKAFMPPRMTTTQKGAIASPAEGMTVYDVTLHKLSVYTGSVWETVTSTTP